MVNQLADKHRSKFSLLSLLLIITVIGVALVFAGCTQQKVQSVTTPSASQSNPTPSQPSVQTVTSKPGDLAINSTKSAQEQTQDTLASIVPDGMYANNVTYFYHSGSENIEIDLTVQNDIVTDAKIIPHNPNPVSARYIQACNNALPTLVIGKRIDQITIPHQVSGSSLTSAAFAQNLQNLINKYKSG